MLYCSRCGVKNEETEKHCIKCGSALLQGTNKEKREDTCFDQPERLFEEECFKIPYGGAIAGIIFGIFIILIGLAIAFGLDIWRWIGAFIVIVIGLLIVAGAVFGLRRR